VPSDKRARQRAGAQARREALARQQKRRRQVRNSIVVVLIAAAVIGSVYLITNHHSGKPATPALPAGPQGRLDRIAINAGCPASPRTKVNTQSYNLPPTTISATATYSATVKTDVGSFVIALNSKESPIAVNSFVFLARHDFFKCVIFHRVVQGFVDQTGDPTGTGLHGPGYQFTEAGPPTATPQYPIGSVALANSDNPGTHTPKTNGSQWFVVTGPSGETLQPDYVVFGQVTSGLGVVQAINKDGAAATSSQTGTPRYFHRILSIKITEA
jgi:cyclophilin family peptidyl-prolyl cis-trans isomerase